MTTTPKHAGRMCLSFLRYVINPTAFEAPDLDEKDWDLLYHFSYRHAILGFAFEGLRHMESNGVKPPKVIIKKWAESSMKIEKKNIIVNHATAKLYQKMRNDGFRCCVLKGQGNNLMYPNVFCRASGDIDVWLASEREKQPDVRRVLEYVRNHTPKGRTIYHHIDYGEFEGIDVEVHYRPSFLNNPIYNHRLQKWFVQQSNAQFDNKVELPGNAGIIAIPTPDFNAVFQLTHIYSHLLNHGIGLRQIIDYYYVIQAVKDKDGLKKTLCYLGLDKIAGAMMWVLHNMLGMDEQYLIVGMDEQRGRVMCKEIMSGGNFGENGSASVKTTGKQMTLWQFYIKKNVKRLYRDIQMMRYFPSECIFEPFFRIYHFFWRMIM